jgi:hypothetical protein
MVLHRFRIGSVDSLSGIFGFLRSTMRDNDKLAVFDIGLVLQNAVFRNTLAVEPGTKCTQATHHHRVFQGSEDPDDKRSRRDQRSNAWIKKKAEPNRHPQIQPQNAPKPPQYLMRSPVL